MLVKSFSRFLRRISGSIDFNEVSQVVEEVITRLNENGVNTGRSSFSSPQATLHELNGLLTRVRRHDRSTLPQLQILFAPTGDIQEIALSSGWGDRFLDLASRFDLAIGR